MKITLLYSLLFFTFFLIVSGQCQTNQQALLLQVKNNLVFNSSLSEKLIQWKKNTDCCTWPGVNCDNIGHVTGVDLSNEPITSGIDGLFDLTHLELLDLSSTPLPKFRIPSRLRNLTNLKELNLVGCNLIGSIPAWISNLTKLEALDLSSNYLTGTLPQFHNLKSLEYISLEYNGLFGDISSINLTQLPNLAIVRLSSNFFNGSIAPALFRHPSSSYSMLNMLDLSHNGFEGSVPESIFELSNMTDLDLSSNRFNGSIDWDMISLKLGSLTYLDLSDNNLEVNVSGETTSLASNLVYLKLSSCNITNFPNTEMSLDTLDLSDNQISGNIPAWVWGGVSAELNLSGNSLIGFEKSEYLSAPETVDLHSNQLHGSVPRQIYSAEYIDISHNYFVSSIPDDLDLQDCAFFSVSNNKLTGAIPNSICDANHLEVVDLSNNNLNGTIPSCLFNGMSSNVLTVLNFKNNSFSGTIPDIFPDTSGLEALSLNGNLFGGMLPKSLANCTYLEVLDVGNNNFQDKFPCWLNNISTLHVLVLRSNKFYGNISCIGNNSWSALQILDIAFNNFSGEIPKEAVKHWKGMMIEENHANKLGHKYLGDVRYDYGVGVTMKGNGIELVKILSIFTSIDLSSNHFHGPIPEDIGSLKSLHLLNLSRNSLTGSILASIGKIQSLESLDLSENTLRGRIPTELTNLNFLSVLDLSYNQLVGRIPTSTQIQSFSATSFEGNEGLCGPPLKDCSTPSVPSPSTNINHGNLIFDWKMGLVIGLGFGTGFVAAVVPWILSNRVDLWYDMFVHRLLHFFQK